jgi:hypothetical protein
MPTAGVKHRAHERLFAAQGARKKGGSGRGGSSRLHLCAAQTAFQGH